MHNISIVERAIFFINDPLLIPLIEKNKALFVKLIAPTINYFSINHWHPKIKLKFKQLNENIKKSEQQVYNEALNDKGNKIELWPKNKQDEEIQLQLAIKLSKKIKEKNNNINELNNYISDLNINEEEEFDEDYGICPITQDYMNNPVLCPSGHYYEKSAILIWLKTHDTEPLTREHLTADMLIEDEEFRKKIIDYRKKFNK